MAQEPAPAAGQTGIVFEDLSFQRGGEPVLSGLSGRWTEQRIGVVGHNGSGKSTLARLLNGLLQPSSGALQVLGRNPGAGPEAMASTVGFIFQNPDHQIIFPTVEEELSFGLRNRKVGRRQARESAREALRDWGLERWAGMPVHSLSEGQKQLVCLLSVLILRPGLLVLDEPFSSLDAATRAYLNRLLSALPQQLVMITHDLEVLRTYDRVIWLHEGLVHRDGPPDAVLPEYEAASDRIAAERPLPRTLLAREAGPPC